MGALVERALIVPPVFYGSMGPVNTNETAIACDESGSEGENVTGAGHRVFVHASVDFTVAEAVSIVAEVRRLAPSQAPEYKSDQLMSRAGREALAWLLSPNGPLTGRAHAYLVDKDYFVGKVVDLLVEEVAHAADVDLYADGHARALAWTLHRQGARALGVAEWSLLLGAFNSLMRAKQGGALRPPSTNSSTSSTESGSAVDAEASARCSTSFGVRSRMQTTSRHVSSTTQTSCRLSTRLSRP